MSDKPIVCLVGNRIGPACLEAVMSHGLPGGIVIGATPRADFAQVEEVAARFHPDAPVVSAAEAIRMIASGDIEAKWLLNLWGELIIRPEILARVGASLNVHPSFLPWGRGSDPVVWTILNQWPAGATLHVMVDDVDAGPIWAQRRVEYSFPCRGGDLYPRVVGACLELFVESWPAIAAGSIVPIAQAEPPAPEARRRDLDRLRLITMDSEPRMTDKELMARLLAYDFGPDFSAQLQIGEDVYHARLQLVSADDEAEARRIGVQPQ